MCIADDHDVLRFNVVMGYTAGVHMRECLEYLLGQLLDVAHGERLLLAECELV